MKHKQIIIIGSGIAGLAAAFYLNKHGISTTVIEARERVGGRIWPDKSFGFPISRGAAWIHGIDGNPLYDLIPQSQDSFYTADPANFFYYDNNGKRILMNKVNEFNEQFSAELEAIKRHAFSLDDDLSLADSLFNIFDLNKISDASERDLLLGKQNFFENYIGANSKHLSSRYWDSEEAIPGAHGIFADAYEGVVNYLSEGCDIRFNAVVKSIEMNPDGVLLKTSQGEISARKVIVTVPLGVLKHDDITFIPPLPSSKKNAIKRLGMGLFNIISLRFPYSFWGDMCDAFFIPEQGCCSTFFNIGKFLKAPILLGYVGGDTAQKLELCSDQEIMDTLMKTFRKFFKTPIPQPEKFFMTRWLCDPYSRGSYSYYAVGSSYDDREALSEPIENKIYFAGEATHAKYPATTHGAYLSGIREAEKIIAEIN